MGQPGTWVTFAQTLRGGAATAEIWAVGKSWRQARPSSRWLCKLPPLAKACGWRRAWLKKGSISPENVAQASHNGDAAAKRIIQHAGNLIGTTLASMVNFFNPLLVFIGGGLTQFGPLFLASVRQSVYQRSLALSTRHLKIQCPRLATQAGLVSAGMLAMQETLKRKIQ